MNTKLISDFWNYMNNCKWEKAENLLHKNFIAEWPQSRVRYNGSHNFISMNANYPGKHQITVIDVYESKNKIIAEVEIKSLMPDGKNLHLYAISIFEVLNDKIAKATEYWADTYDAPLWQEQWCERY